MLNDKRIKNIEKKVPLMINEGYISKDEGNNRFVEFYLENSLISSNTAKLLNMISSDDNTKKQFNFIDESFESYLWVINSSYYSMFYSAGALLAKIGIKIKSEIGVHRKTFEALVYYFLITNRIEKHYIEEFEEALQESQGLLGNEEQAMKKKVHEMIEDYDFEMGKRAKFTYNIGEKAKMNKAMTSLSRAANFYNECLKIIDKMGG